MIVELLTYLGIICLISLTCLLFLKYDQIRKVKELKKLPSIEQAIDFDLLNDNDKFVMHYAPERTIEVEVGEERFPFKGKIKECAVLLNDFKKKLPLEVANKISRIALLSNDDHIASTINIEHSNSSTDEHAVLLGRILLNGDFTINELRAIISHEVAHIKLGHLNYFQAMIAPIGAIPAIIPGLLLGIALTNLYFNISRPYPSYNKQEILSPIALSLLILALRKWYSMYSQKTEFQADEEGLRLNKDDPLALASSISSLEKLHAEDDAGTEQSYLNLIPRLYNNFNSFFSDHPDLKRRKEALYKNASTNNAISVADNQSHAAHGHQFHY